MTATGHEGVPIDDAVREGLSRVSTATLATQLFKRGFPHQFLVGIKPINPSRAAFVGEAFTMRYIPSRPDIDTLDVLHERGPNNLQWEAAEAIGPGQVLVVDSGRDIRAGSAGEILVTRMMRRGAVAAVTDGAFRDGPALARVPLPTYAQATTASTRPAYFHAADLNVPIGCAGVAVYPGDVLVGDGEGVVVIPRHLATAVASDAVEQEQIEQYILARVDAGEEVWGLYPPNDRVREEYRAWREASSDDGDRA